MSDDAIRFTALVADDNYYNRDLCKVALDHVGYDVIEAEDGEAALTMLHEQSCDLLILDLAMPRVDGLAVLREIRGNTYYDALPIIVLTANPHMTGEVTALGTDYVLYKPIDIAVFAQLAERLKRKFSH